MAVVQSLKDRMTSMKRAYEKKNIVDQKRAVQKEQVKTAKMHQKISKAMNKEVPKKIREIIYYAVTQFRDGKVSQNDVNHLLKTVFSDKTFSDLLKCSQGDLKVCKKINLKKWKEKADKEVKSIAKKAKEKKVISDGKEKERKQTKINKIVQNETKSSQAVRRAERSVLK